MADGPLHRSPRSGDIVETKPVKFTSKSKILGTNPTNGGEFVRIEKKNLDVVFPEEIIEAITQDNGPFVIDEVGSWPAEITEGDDKRGLLLVKLLPESEIAETDESGFEIDSPKREEPILWEGTPQSINPEDVKDRRSTFTEDDPRGSKNDLLGGHL